MSRRANDSLPTMFFLGVLLLLAVWALDDLRAWTKTWFAAAPAKTACAAPAENEQLLITVSRRDEGYVTTCMYVGSRGSYSRRSVRIVKTEAAR